jgi:uncharacterized membrane protein YbhN (UPF0104 family)
MPPFLKRFLNIVGGAIAVIGILFVALRLQKYGNQIDFNRFSIAGWLIIFGLAIGYGLSNIMLALAWHHLLDYLGVNAKRWWALRAFGISQIAKYVPGNIFHFAGRQTIGMSAGIPAGPLVRSTVWELGLIIFCGVLFLILLIPLLNPSLSVWAAFLSFIAVGVLVCTSLYRYLNTAIASSYGWYMGFLTISGLIFSSIIAMITEAPLFPGNFWLLLCGSYVAAWLIGLITPGAPAGMGVRELVLLFLLGNIISESNLIFAVSLGRVVTVLGDFMFFFASVAIKEKNAM